jgi:hypothetical protein
VTLVWFPLFQQKQRHGQQSHGLGNDVEHGTREKIGIDKVTHGLVSFALWTTWLKPCFPYNTKIGVTNSGAQSMPTLNLAIIE